ncbi:unnamed protein product [Caenorhabditis sp. 36 PRJEB53466]|nr:unnamed protein product [Caenorhabditis sp. 36 PRJEB53466]
MQRLRDLFNGAFSKLSPIRRIRRKRVFRLLDLPSVPLLKCLGMFGTIERCHFSKCSKTAKAALMSLKKEPIFLLAYFNPRFQIAAGFGVYIENYRTFYIDNPTDSTFWRRLEGAEFTQQDLNRFVKFWMAGANPRLEFFFMFRNIRAKTRINQFSVVDGIRFVEIDETVERNFLLHEKGGPPFKIACSGGLDIVRQDGVKATIKSYPYAGLDMHAFHFIVWPHSSSEWLEIDHTS